MAASPPLASVRPSGAKARLSMLSVTQVVQSRECESLPGSPACPPDRVPLSMTHSLIVPSQLPVASVRPSGLKARAHRVGMRLPGQVQEPPFFAPHAYFPPPAARSPVLPIEADGHRPGDIKGLVQDRLTQGGPGKGGILHLDPVQGRPPNAELR